MRRSHRLAAALVLGFVSACAGDPAPSTPAAPSVPPAPTVTTATITFTGGYDTEPSDGGRPTRLIAAALGVTQAQFQFAFSLVTPASGGQEPAPEQVMRNKAALMSVLGPLGVTNERLDEVSNYYRFMGAAGQTWPRTAAAATATITNGVVTAVTLTSSGAGYSSTPAVVVSGVSGTPVTATLGFSTTFASNGTVTTLTIVR